MANKTVNVFTKGLKSSVDPVDQEKESYSYALNAVKENIINNPEVLINEKGFTEYIDLGYRYTLLGTRYLGKKEYLLFIKNNDSDSIVFNRILLINDGKLVRVILDRTDLNFNSSHPIMSTYRINYKNQRIVYWVDGLNDDRVINIDINSTAFNINLFSVNSAALKPGIQATVLDSGGAVTSGQWFIGVSYNLGDSYTTSPLLVTKGISIASGDYYNGQTPNTTITKLFGQTDGDIIPVPTRKAIKVNLTNIDNNFDSYNLIFLRRSTTGDVIRVVSNIDKVDLEYTFTGNEGEISTTITLNDIITDSLSYYASEAIIQKDNRLLRGNSKLKSTRVDYQAFANNIIARYKIIEELVYDADNINGIKNDFSTPGIDPPYFNAAPSIPKTCSISPSYLANTANFDTDNKTLMRDEVYSLGIGFELLDGSESDVFHIPGRLPNTFSVLPTGVGEYNRPFTPIWDTDTYGTDVRWKNTNTAIKQTLGELGYWRSSESYPDGYKMPTNGEKNGSGKSYIRHHKMPSDVLEPIYRTEITGDPNNTVGTPVNYKIYKRNLALDFSNIIIPPELKGKIKRIKLYFTPRNSTNKSILSKGLLYNTRKDGSTYTTGTLLNTNQTVSDAETILEFQSPDVNFNFKQATLSGDKLKVCGVDKGYVNIVGDKIPGAQGSQVLRNFYYGILFNNTLFNTTGRRQGSITAACFYNQRAIPKAELYSRQLNKLIFVDANYVGSSDVGDLSFKGTENSSVVQLQDPIILKPTPIITPWSQYYPELQYPTGSDQSTLISLSYGNRSYGTYYEKTQNTSQNSIINNIFYDTSLYVSIISSKANQYGAIRNLQYVPLNNSVPYNGEDNFQITISGGDTFIDVHHFRKTRYESIGRSSDGNGIPLRLNKYGEYNSDTLDQPINLLTEVFEDATVSYSSYICETDLNIRMRRSGTALNEQYFPKSYFGAADLNFYDNKALNPEFYKIEPPYNVSDIKLSFAAYTSVDEFAQSTDDIRYSTRIIYSDKQNLEDKTDNYRKVRANNYRDLPLDKGGITIFFVNQEKLYAVTRDTIFNVYTSNQSLQSDSGTNITVGTGEFLGIEPIDMISIDGGYAGTTSKLSFTESPYGYFFVDRYKGKFILFDRNPEDIAVKDIVEFIQENFNIKAIDQLNITDTEFDNPLNNYGYVCGFDAELNRFLITKLDYLLVPELLAKYKGNYDPTVTYTPGDIYRKSDGLLYVFHGTISQYVTLADSTNLSDYIPSDVSVITYNYTLPLHGTILNTNDGSITYTPNNGYVGSDNFIISSNCASEPINLSIKTGNNILSQSFTKNTCDSGTGSTVVYTVPANTYFADTQIAADALAQADIDANGQNYANTNGTCTIYVWGNITNENTQIVGGGTYADIMLRTYKGTSSTIPPAPSIGNVYPCTNPSIAMQFRMVPPYAAPNDFTVSISNQTSVQLIAPGAPTPIYPKMLISGGGVTQYMAPPGKAQGDMFLLQTITV